MDHEDKLPTKDDWLEVVLSSDVDTLINLYQTSTMLSELLDDTYTLNLLSKQHRLYHTQIYDFADFIEAYDKQYASERCEQKYNLKECIYKASKNGQLFWIYNYLDKDSSLAEKAFVGAVIGNNTELVKWLINNYTSIMHSIKYNNTMLNHLIVKVIENDNKELLSLLIEELVKVFIITPTIHISNMLYDALSKKVKKITPKMLKFVIRYIKKNYNKLLKNTKGRYLRAPLTYALTVNDLANGYKHLMVSPETLPSYLAGASKHGLSTFTEEVERLTSLLTNNKDEIMAKVLYIMFNKQHGYVNQRILSWILNNFNIDFDKYELLNSITTGSNLENFKLLLENLPNVNVLLTENIKGHLSEEKENILREHLGAMNESQRYQ
jgi:hypothetical protein